MGMTDRQNWVEFDDEQLVSVGRFGRKSRALIDPTLKGIKYILSLKKKSFFLTEVAMTDTSL